MGDAPALSVSELHAFLSARSDKVIETSCATVYLQGERALKIKKPVNFGFLDYSTLEKRQWALQRELNFNRAAAPDIYRAVHPVMRTSHGFDLAGAGDAIEYALEMRRFDDEAVLAHQPWVVDADLAETLGRAVAQFHADAKVLTKGGKAALAFTIGSNAALIRALGSRLGDDVETVLSAIDAAFETFGPLIEARESQGFSRHCHGDLHLGNILLENNQPVLFDCIEFNDMLSELDVLYDLAFLLMDLDFRRRTDAANRVMNAYLDEAARRSPDSLWSGLAALPLTQAVRACVRCHVSAHSGDDEAACAYLAAALRHLQPSPPRLMAIGGFSGSGKSTLARLIAPGMGTAPGAVVVRTDEIRKRLVGAGPRQPLPTSAYSAELTKRTYAMAVQQSRDILLAGRSVILDATFLDEELRDGVAALAADLGLPFEGVWLHGDPALLAHRIRSRSGDASDATIAILETQLGSTTRPRDWRTLEASDLEAAARVLIGTSA